MSATHTSLAAPAVRPAGAAKGRSRLINIGLMVAVGVALIGIAYVANRPASTAAGGLTPVDLGGIPRGPAPIVGQPAPDIQATTVDAAAFRLSDLVGSPVWLTFGATWCQPCRAESADIEAAYEAFEDRGVQVVQVFMSNDAATVSDYATRVGLTFTKVPDPTSQIAVDYRVLGIPTHYFIDATGSLTQLKVGTLDRATMDSILKGLVDSGP
jgi:cytochrome c biogenesis protein CcmG/thiol:disulfide interchange protein DsbE